MELTNIEVAAIETALAEAKDQDSKDLNELQLALIGGGCGDTIAY